MAVATGIKGSYSLKEGYGVVFLPLANSQNPQIVSPTVNKGTTISQFDTLLDDRFDRPRYYTSTPSGLPY